MKLIIIIALCLISFVVYGESVPAKQQRTTVLFRDCLNISGIDGFDMTRYLGRWYELERFYNFYQWGDCATTDYFDNGDGTYGVKYNQNILGTLPPSFDGTVTIPDPTKGELIVNYPATLIEESEPNYIIMDTDYDEYAVVYDCKTIIPGLWIEEKSWILSRNMSASDECILTAIESQLTLIGLPVENYWKTNQENCERAPEPQP